MMDVLIAGAYGLGGTIGWTLLDRWLDSRLERRERLMRNVTPGRVK